METCTLFCCLGTKDRKEIELDSRGQHSDSRTVATCDGRPTTYGFGFLRANTFWKSPRVYFHMHQTSSPYHVGVGHNHHFSAETFFCQRCCDTLFWPIGPCIMLSLIRMHPRVGVQWWVVGFLIYCEVEVGRLVEISMLVKKALNRWS
jgi:hypothetical protein